MRSDRLYRWAVVGAVFSGILAFHSALVLASGMMFQDWNLLVLPGAPAGMQDPRLVELFQTARAHTQAMADAMSALTSTARRQTILSLCMGLLGMVMFASIAVIARQKRSASLSPNSGTRHES